jgi:leader peptidase (prepilin peptidase)/N-methyltransferase
MPVSARPLLGVRTRISARYPLVEILTAALFCVLRLSLGPTPTGLAWCGFSAAMVALAFIDWDTTLLPDDMTLPLLWAGLLARRCTGLTCPCWPL